MQHQLSPFDPTTAPALTLTAVAAQVANNLILQFNFAAEDAVLNQIIWPAPQAAPARTIGLWEHTCCEAFVGLADGRYFEMNLSPSGAWQVLAFAQYRQPAPLPAAVAPHITVTTTAGQRSLHATVPTPWLAQETPVAIGLTTVLKTPAGLSYWAIRHPQPQPDFHHADGWVKP